METEFLQNASSNEYVATETTLLEVRFLATSYLMYKIGKKVYYIISFEKHMNTESYFAHLVSQREWTCWHAVRWLLNQ